MRFISEHDKTMPMKRLSTPCLNHSKRESKTDAKEFRNQPRRQTLDFLSQFARVYQAEPALCPEMSGYVLN